MNIEKVVLYKQMIQKVVKRLNQLETNPNSDFQDIIDCLNYAIQKASHLQFSDEQNNVFAQSLSSSKLAQLTIEQVRSKVSNETVDGAFSIFAAQLYQFYIDNLIVEKPMKEPSWPIAQQFGQKQESNVLNLQKAAFVLVSVQFVILCLLLK